MNIRFDGKVVAVSGAGIGFGRAIARGFAGLGGRVFGCDIRDAALVETRKAGVDTSVVDLSNRAAAAAWIRRIEDRTGAEDDGIGRVTCKTEHAADHRENRDLPEASDQLQPSIINGPPSL